MFHFLAALSKRGCLCLCLSRKVFKVVMAIPVRWLVVVVTFLATVVDFINRLNINVAMVSMVEHQSFTANETNARIVNAACPWPEASFENQAASSESFRMSKREAPRFDWDPSTQGLILGGFFYSYIIVQVPMGRFAEIFGAKSIIGVGLLGSGKRPFREIEKRT